MIWLDIHIVWGHHPKAKMKHGRGPENWIPAASISRCDWINLFLSSRILHSIFLLAKVGRTNRSEDQEWATCEASPRPHTLVCHCWIYTCWQQSRCQQNECKPHNQAATDRWTASLVTSRSDFPALLGIHCSISGRLNVETSEIFSRCFVSIRNQHCKICKVSWSSNTADRIMACCHCELNVKPTMGWVDFWKAREKSVLATTTGLSKFQNQMRQHLTTHRKTRIAELLTCTRSHGIWEPSHRHNCFKRPRARRCLLHTSHGDCEYNDHNDHEPIGSDRINRIVLHTSATSAQKFRGDQGDQGDPIDFQNRPMSALLQYNCNRFSTLFKISQRFDCLNRWLSACSKLDHWTCFTFLLHDYSSFCWRVPCKLETTSTAAETLKG